MNKYTQQLVGSKQHKSRQWSSCVAKQRGRKAQWDEQSKEWPTILTWFVYNDYKHDIMP